MSDPWSLLPIKCTPFMNRTLGKWEYEMFFEVPRRCNILVTAELKIKDKEIDVEKLERAVRCTIYKQPHLRCNIDKTTNPVKFKPANDLSGVFQTLEIGSLNENIWQEIYEKEVNTDLIYGSDAPLFRCTFVRDSLDFNAILVLYHHGIGDGNSGYKIVNDILTFYDKLINGEQFQVNSLVPAPCYEEGTKPECYTNEDLKVIETMKAAKVDRLKNFKPLLPFEVEKEEDNPNFFNRAIFLDGDESNFTAIRSKCRKENVTIGCLLYTGAFFAMAALHAEHKTNGKIEDYEGMMNAIIDFPVSMHDRVEPKLHKDLVAFFITEMTFKIPCIDLKTQFWQLCRDLKKQITSKFEMQEPKLFSEFLHQLNNEYADLIASVPLGNVNDVILNSGGAYPYKLEHDNVQLEKLHMASSPCIPFFCNYFLLVQSTKIFTYDCVYSGSGGENKENAKKLTHYLKKLVENSHSFESEINLEMVLKTLLPQTNFNF